MNYFKDMTNAEIGTEIERLCNLADLKLPELPKETAEFLKDEFNRVPKDVFRKSIDEFIGGKLQVEAYAKANAKFLCRMVRAYIDKYKHNIKFKPREYKNIDVSTQVAQISEEERKEQDYQSISHLRKMWSANLVDKKAEGFMSYHYIVLVHKLLEKYKLLYPIQTTDDQKEVEQWVELFKRYRRKLNMIAINSAPTDVKKKSVRKVMEAMETNANFDYQIIGEVFTTFNHTIKP